MKTLFYATIDPRLGIPVVWEFSGKERKDGQFKAEGMLPFMGYITILSNHHVADCGVTREEAMDKLRWRNFFSIKSLDIMRGQLVSEVSLINSTEPKHIKFPIQPKS